MWTPTDINALPSANEVECGKQAIMELEGLLKSAVEVVKQAKSRVATLKRDIKARRAWLAPIRRLPVEILSEIFLVGSRLECLMPVTITEVSRHWRKVILSTPKAWSIIEPASLKNSDMAPQYLSTFTEKSNPCTVHVRVALDDDCDFDFDEEYQLHPLLGVSTSVIDKMSCLCVPGGLFTYMSDNMFPNLTMLSLIGVGRHTITSSHFNRSRLPQIQYLNAGECTWHLSTDAMHLFPPLQYLKIDGYNGPAYIEAIKGCCITLRGLEVGGLKEEPPQSAPVTIHFPLLKYLGISSWSPSPAWQVQAITPALRSYKETRSCRNAQDILQKDVKKVTALRCTELPQLDSFVALRLLQLWVADSPGLVEQLQRQNQVCPSLRLIEFKYRTHPTPMEIDNISLMIKTTRPHLKLTFSKWWSDLPGARHDLECDHAMWDEE